VDFVFRSGENQPIKPFSVAAAVCKLPTRACVACFLFVCELFLRAKAATAFSASLPSQNECVMFNVSPDRVGAYRSFGDGCYRQCTLPTCIKPEHNNGTVSSTFTEKRYRPMKHKMQKRPKFNVVKNSPS